MTKPYVTMHVRIKQTASLFPGEEAIVAYVGTDGISVYLKDEAKFDDCVPLNNDEWEALA